MAKKMTAKELCDTKPSVWPRRKEYIIALCNSAAYRTAKEIIDIANEIVEYTEQP